MTLKLHAVAPRQGLVWVRRAFAVFFRRPLPLASLFAAFLFASLLAVALPYVGGVLLLMALPLLSLGYMIATRAAVAGAPVHPGQFFEPLRGDARRRRQLLLLCAVYAVATIVIIWLSEAVDGGRFDRLQVLLASGGDDATRKEVDALLDDPRLRDGLLLRFGLAALLAVPFWHAPALVWWGGQGVAQALFSSTLAVWRSKGAFAMYTLAWVGVVAVFGLITGTLFSLLGARQLVGIAAVPAGLMFTTVFYVSLYFTFVDSFGEPDGESRP